jgi:hypothetical protein
MPTRSSRRHVCVLDHTRQPTSTAGGAAPSTGSLARELARAERNPPIVLASSARGCSQSRRRGSVRATMAQAQQCMPTRNAATYGAALAPVDPFAVASTLTHTAMSSHRRAPPLPPSRRAHHSSGCARRGGCCCPARVAAPCARCCRRDCSHHYHLHRPACRATPPQREHRTAGASGGGHLRQRACRGARAARQRRACAEGRGRRRHIRHSSGRRRAQPA